VIMSENQSVIIIKLNPQREETWRYDGRVLAEDQHSLLIEAYFNRKDLPFHGITLKENDRFLERYYDNRWFNIFQIHDREDDKVKAWYCNITQPAEFSPGKIAYVDLALDVLVFPDGSHLVLDEDEFDQLSLDADTHDQALAGLDILLDMVHNQQLAQVFKA